jgi:hypothetical protein
MYWIRKVSRALETVTVVACTSLCKGLNGDTASNSNRGVKKGFGHLKSCGSLTQFSPLFIDSSPSNFPYIHRIALARPIILTQHHPNSRDKGGAAHTSTHEIHVCEVHAYEVHAMHARKVHADEVHTPVRCTLIP